MIDIKKLKEFRDEEGVLFETIRCDDPIFSGKFGQNLVSIVNPDIVKGFHLHHHQTDYTTCLVGNIFYVTIDARTNPQKPRVESFIIGERNRILIKTPPEIWHGYRTLDKKPAVVLYTTDQPYNSLDADTEEIDPFTFGRDIWEL